MSQRVKALVLAGGFGTRLRPITNTTPKCLVPVGGKPMLNYWFDALEAAGIRDVLINTHHLRDAVTDHIERENAARDLDVVEAYEPELLGSAGTVHANRAFADDADDIVVIYADNLSTLDLPAMVKAHQDSGQPMTMALFRASNPSQCGIAAQDDTGRIVSFVEKPDAPQSDLANAGVYVLTAKAFNEIADMNVFDFGFDVIPQFVGRMQGYVHDGYHRDIGTHEALDAAEADVADLFGGTA